MTDIEIRPGVKVLLFERSDGPYFALREFDTKILRASTSKKNALRIHGASEQAIRARITQVIMKMKLNALKGHKNEIDVLKRKGILGKRAPKCSMLNTTDTIRLLKAFGCDSVAADLEALMKERGIIVNIPDETYPDEAGGGDDDDDHPSPSSEREHEQSTPKIRPEDVPHTGPKSVKRLLQFASSPQHSARHVQKRPKIEKPTKEQSRGSIAHGSFLWNGVRVQGEEGGAMPSLILPSSILPSDLSFESGDQSPRGANPSASPVFNASLDSGAAPPGTASASISSWAPIPATQLPSFLPATLFSVLTGPSSDFSTLPSFGSSGVSRTSTMPTTPGLDVTPALAAGADIPRDASYFLLSPDSNTVEPGDAGSTTVAEQEGAGNFNAPARDGWLFD